MIPSKRTAPLSPAPRLHQGRVAIILIFLLLALIGGIADAVSQVAANNEQAPTPLITRQDDWHARLTNTVTAQVTSPAAVSRFQGWSGLTISAVSASLLDTAVIVPGSYSDAATFNLLVRIFAAMHDDQPKAEVNITVAYSDQTAVAASLQYYSSGYFSVISGPYSFTANLRSQPSVARAVARYWMGATLPHVGKGTSTMLPNPAIAS